MTLPRQRGLTEQAANTAIDTACRLLRLPSIRNEFSDIADRALKDQMTYRGFLAELLMAECDDRSRRRSERRIKAAGFPRDKSLRTFDFDANPNLDAATIHTLASCEWIKKSQPLCLIGDSGTGKSHMLIALGTEAAMAGYRVKYVLATKLVNELVEAADEKQLSKTIARYGRVDLLCIDELGYMELDRRGAELLFQVLTEREEKNSVAIASNESFGKAHMFRRTRARCCRNFTGSGGWRDGCGHRVGYQRDQLLRPAVRLLGADLGSAGIADEVGAIQAVESAASIEAPTVRVSGYSRDIVWVEDEHAVVRADCIRPARHQRWQEPVSRGILRDRRGHRYFPEVRADLLPTVHAGEDGHARILSGLRDGLSSFPAGLRGRKAPLLDVVAEIDHCGLRVHAERGGDELGIHGGHKVDETGAADHAGREPAVVKDVGKVGS